jgi:hypothetical protein
LRARHSPHYDAGRTGCGAGALALGSAITASAGNFTIKFKPPKISNLL